MPIAPRAGEAVVVPPLRSVDVGLFEELLARLPALGEADRMAGRLLLAALLGAVIGAQREVAGKSAGLRTHMLVALGTAYFVVVSIEMGIELEDLSRVIQGLATGVGFIGAGVIRRRERSNQVMGLTTAASLWVTAAVGVGVGLGRAGTATLVVAMTWLILTLMGALSNRLARGRADRDAAQPARRRDPR